MAALGTSLRTVAANVQVLVLAATMLLKIHKLRSMKSI